MNGTRNTSQGTMLPRKKWEEVCHGRLLEREGYKQRIVILGPTEEGRVLAIILEPTEDSTAYYPVTAYESRKARRIYQEEKGGEAA